MYMVYKVQDWLNKEGMGGRCFVLRHFFRLIVVREEGGLGQGLVDGGWMQVTGEFFDEQMVGRRQDVREEKMWDSDERGASYGAGGEWR